jgi:tetratricopeptide (TPR) repeat protein/tRNA A-37 threonylcarbamoyl transferase component Bud32/TolB-like protein
MTDSFDRLSAALADRYRLERELGQGGMATVYLAEDLKHHRKVAVKVLRPELAATLGPERFAREIEVAARLQHPHILGVLDSGDADGFFYYVMPFVEGETLRDRLARAGELPVHEAVRLLGEIAEALAVAHRAGVVHRDIKPENVLLSGRHAMVMDFGVAKAVTEASGRQQLTTAGVALGTPAYMAPEQASADPQMDGRVDIYAIGILGYEMLTGHTPFHGLNPQQTLAAHVTQTPPPVGQQRSGLSPVLEATIMRCLAKRPADRFQTADELVTALEPLATPSGGMTPTHTQPVSAALVPGAGKPLGKYAVAGAVVVAVAALFFWKPWAGGGGRPLDPNVVAVLPFRVAGADPSVQYLRQGMVDLLQAKLTGEGGPRAADTRSVLAAVRDAGGTDTDDLPGDAVTRVARKIGAGRVLQGSIVGPPDHLVISASLVEMPGGRVVAQSSVDGPKESLFVLVDRLTAQLLALGAGAKSTQLSALTTTNLDALRAYLDGVTAYRRGAFQTATPLLERAVELDSTFALALSALVEASGWHPAAGDINRVRRLAWQYRDRLNPQDQVFLTLRLGSMYPRQTPWQVQIADAEKAAQSMPESADAWYYLGDGLFHGGRLADIPDPEARARQAFEKAFELDSLYGGPITHLARLNFVTGDTAAQRLWTRRQIALDSTAESVPLARWDLLQSSADAAGIKAFLAGLSSQPLGVPQAILFQDPRDSVTIAHQPELLDAVHRLATTRAERNDMAFSRWFYLLNRGQPAEAARWLDTLRTIAPGSAAIQSVLGAIWYGGALPDTSTLANNIGAANLLRFSQGDLSVASAILTDVRAAAARDTLQGFWSRWTPLVEAWVAVEQGAPGAERLVDVADSLWRGYEGNSTFASIQLARLYQAQGRTDRALRAVRRRYSPNGELEPPGLAEAYRLEGQLAAQVGDRADAIRAYRYYLRMRIDAEPSRIPQRDSVRAELAKSGDLEGTR